MIEYPCSFAALSVIFASSGSTASASPVCEHAIRYWKLRRSFATHSLSINIPNPSGPQSLVEQSMLRLERHADAHGGALADDRMNVDGATHELQPLADVEQPEAALSSRQAVDRVHLESDTGVDHVQSERVVERRAAHGRALRARVLDHVLQQLAHGLE